MNNKRLVAVFLFCCWNGSAQSFDDVEIYPKPILIYEGNGLSAGFLINAMSDAAKGETGYFAPPLTEAVGSGAMVFKKKGMNFGTLRAHFSRQLRLDEVIEERVKEIERRGFQTQVTTSDTVSIIQKKSMQATAGAGKSRLVAAVVGNEAVVSDARNKCIWFSIPETLVSTLIESVTLPSSNGSGRGDRYAQFLFSFDGLPRSYRKLLFDRSILPRLVRSQTRDEEDMGKAARRAAWESTAVKLLGGWYTDVSELVGEISLSSQSGNWEFQLVTTARKDSQSAVVLKSLACRRSRLSSTPTDQAIAFLYCAMDSREVFESPQDRADWLLYAVDEYLPVDLSIEPLIRKVAENHVAEVAAGLEFFTEDDVYLWAAVAVEDAETLLGEVKKTAKDSGWQTIEDQKDLLSFAIGSNGFSLAICPHASGIITFAVGGEFADEFCRVKAATAQITRSSPPLLHVSADFGHLAEAAHRGVRLGPLKVSTKSIETGFVRTLQQVGFPFGVPEAASLDSEALLDLTEEHPSSLSLSAFESGSALRFRGKVETGTFAFLSRMYLHIMSKRTRPR